MLKTYKPKKGLVPSYKIFPQSQDPVIQNMEFIALPEHVARKGLRIEWRGKSMVIQDLKPAFSIGMFNDRFGRNFQYKLFYYEWQPDKQEEQVQWA